MSKVLGAGQTFFEPLGLWNSGVDLTAMRFKARWSMPEIAVLLAIQPRMLSEVVGGVVGRQPDIDEVGEVIVPSALGLAILTTGVQVAIMTVTDSHL